MSRPVEGWELSAYVDGDLPAKRMAEIEVELQRSPELRAILEEMLADHRALAALGATRDLPSLALSLQGGGKIGLDPAASQEAPVALNALFQFELPVLALTALALLPLAWRGHPIGRTMGALLLVGFVAYIAMVLVRGS